MNPLKSDEDPVDAWLRSGAEEIPDGEFSSRVLASLPRRRKTPSIRSIVVAFGAAAGFALALAAGASVTGFLQAWEEVGSRAASHLANPWIAASVGIAAAAAILGFDSASSEENPL